MNLVTLGLLLSSLAAAGVWSPHHEPKPSHHEQRHPADDQVLREGHRVVVVEYERHVPPHFAEQVLHPPAADRLIEEAKDKIQEAASVLPNLGQGVSTPHARPDEAQAAGSAKSMICDAYGVCKDKVAALIGKSKEKTTEIEDISKAAVKKAGEKASQLKEGAKGAARDAEERASQLKESAKDTVKDTIDAAKEKASMARDRVGSTVDKVSQIKEDTKDAMEKVVESAKETGQDIARNISGIAKRAEHKAEKTARETRGNLTDILRRAKEVAFDAAVYVWAPETGQAAAAILHLLGFATAYGACVWVTFVSGNVLATALPRQQFGLVQSKLYPVYFRVVAYSTALTLGAHFLGRNRRILAERVQSYNLLGALVLVLINMFFLEPMATKVSRSCYRGAFAASTRLSKLSKLVGYVREDEDREGRRQGEGHGRCDGGATGDGIGPSWDDGCDNNEEGEGDASVGGAGRGKVWIGASKQKAEEAQHLLILSQFTNLDESLLAPGAPRTAAAGELLMLAGVFVILEI
ncbi:hypothetical protein B296_00008490 [Ensete ventricosum]|uniref:TMEM205-like domain-containing protein n=1 Tax=Ensete ventricosum TaxID=4639 RepID=A0A427BBD0_ENSVE|nr:hypothetical protein B296_00008490 [Ensete ventricosum]